jgi:type I restriction enzyme R subunit
MTSFTESVVEDATLEYFAELGYSIVHGPDIAPEQPAQERASYGDVVLIDRLRSALARINPHLFQTSEVLETSEVLDEVVRKVLNAGHVSPALFENNHRFHQLLTDGVSVEYKRPDGTIGGDQVWLIDFDHIDNCEPPVHLAS